MQLSEIVMAPIAKIAVNPYRNLATYPIIRSKVDALKASIRTVGMWESIIVRPSPGGRFQQAFGHQRIEAAKELGLTEVPVIVRQLNDEQMVQFMGRENGEDYSADFLVMLNTWEAGLDFAQREKKPKAVDIARLLGWTRMMKGHEVMNDIATACAGGLTLINEGHLDRQDLEGLSTRAARDIVTRALSRMESIERSARTSGAPAKEVERAKSFVGKGVKATVSEARAGTVPSSQLGSRVDTNTLAAAGRSRGKLTPLFATFGRALVDAIGKLLDKDATAEKLAEIVKVLDQVVDEDDRVILRQLDFQLGEVGSRAQRWRKRLATDKVKSLSTVA